MPSLVDMVKFEAECPPRTIRLVKSGEFYRAYNHSAWLFQCCVAEHKVCRKFVKTLGQDAYYIGFPEKSQLGNIGKRPTCTTDFGFDVTLSDEEAPDEEGYATWLATGRRSTALERTATTGALRPTRAMRPTSWA